jgi:hypothetical protein
MISEQARPADPDLVRGALADVAAAGPFFALGVGAGGPQWRAAADLYAAGLPGLVASTGAQLKVTEARVAASTVQLGYAARLWSPVLGCVLLHGVVPDLAGLSVAAGPPMRLRVPAPRGWLADGEPGLAALAYRMVVPGQLEPMRRGFPVKVAAGLLHGNAAAAMTAALRVLVAGRPGLERPARALAQRLLAAGLLRGTGELTGPGLEFRRRSCCLFYRVPGGGLCGDCPLPRPDGAGLRSPRRRNQ